MTLEFHAPTPRRISSLSRRLRLAKGNVLHEATAAQPTTTEHGLLACEHATVLRAAVNEIGGKQQRGGGLQSL